MLKQKVITGLCLFVIGLLAVGFIWTLLNEYKNESPKYNRPSDQRMSVLVHNGVPNAASHIKQIGEGWYYFRIEGQGRKTKSFILVNKEDHKQLIQVW